LKIQKNSSGSTFLEIFGNSNEILNTNSISAIASIENFELFKKKVFQNF